MFPFKVICGVCLCVCVCYVGICAQTQINSGHIFLLANPGACFPKQGNWARQMAPLFSRFKLIDLYCHLLRLSLFHPPPPCAPLIWRGLCFLCGLGGWGVGGWGGGGEGVLSITDFKDSQKRASSGLTTVINNPKVWTCRGKGRRQVKEQLVGEGCCRCLDRWTWML